MTKEHPDKDLDAVIMGTKVDLFAEVSSAIQFRRVSGAEVLRRVSILEKMS